MGIDYFILIVAFLMAGVMFFLFNSFFKKMLGFREDAITLEEYQELIRKNEFESRKAQVYINDFMMTLERARCQKERRRNVASPPVLRAGAIQRRALRRAQ